MAVHAENPQIYQLYHIKKYFGNLKTAIVFHGIEYLQREKFAEWRNVYLPSIDVFGFRTLNLVKNGFLCEAGSTNELVMKLQEIEQMSEKKIKAMQHEAFITAKSYSETEVARKYLETVVGE